MLTQYTSITLGVILALLFVYFLTRIKRKKPNDLNEPSLVKGLAAFFDGNDIKALEELKGLALNNKGTPDIYLAIGFLYRKLGDYTKAAQVHEVILLNKDIDIIYRKLLITELAKDYLLADMPVKTLAVLKDNLDNKNNPENFCLAALASLSVKNIDNAVSYSEKYNKLTNKSINEFHAKCMIEKALATFDTQKAAKFIKNALSESPKCRPARFINVNFLMKELKYPKAIEEYIKIIREGLWRDKKDIEKIQKVMLTEAGEKKFQKTLEELSLNNSNDPFVYIALANLMIEYNDQDEAKRVLGNYIKNKNAKIIAIKEYAKLFNDETINTLSANQKSYHCIICKTEYNDYSDDCTHCKSFDSIFAK